MQKKNKNNSTKIEAGVIISCFSINYRYKIIKCGQHNIET